MHLQHVDFGDESAVESLYDNVRGKFGRRVDVVVVTNADAQSEFGKVLPDTDTGKWWNDSVRTLPTLSPTHSPTLNPAQHTNPTYPPTYYPQATNVKGTYLTAQVLRPLPLLLLLLRREGRADRRHASSTSLSSGNAIFTAPLGAIELLRQRSRRREGLRSAASRYFVPSTNPSPPHPRLPTQPSNSP